MLIGGVINDQLGDDAKATFVRGSQEQPKIVQRSIVGMDLGVVGDVVTVVFERRDIEGQQP